MTSADSAIKRWAEIVQGKTALRPLRSSNVFMEGESVFSYGHHFELARPLRDKKRRLTGFLLNGDRFSNTTTGHQSSVRGYLRHADADKVIIPFTALQAAGVDLSSVRLVHVLGDRTTVQKHHSDTFPEGAKWITTPNYKSVPIDDPEVVTSNRDYWREYHQDGNEEEPWWIAHNKIPDGEKQVLMTSNSFRASEITVTTNPDGSKSYDWKTTHHWLGESLIRARVRWTVTEQCPDCGGFGRGPFVGERWEYGCITCRGTGEHTVWRHRWTLFLSGFDHQEPNPLYFLCELPYRCKATTVAEAYEALKPDPVKLAEQMGRTYTRQGDIFAVPTTHTVKTLKELGARIEQRVMRNSPRPGVNLPYLLGTNHTATEVAYLPNGLTLARGMLYHNPDGRRQDHVRRKMGDGKAWHLIIKNTVPTTVRR